MPCSDGCESRLHAQLRTSALTDLDVVEVRRVLKCHQSPPAQFADRAPLSCLQLMMAALRAGGCLTLSLAPY